MKKIKWGSLFLAIISTFCLMGVGVAIGEQSILGAIIAVIILVISMGYGFSLKKKMRENGEL